MSMFKFDSLERLKTANCAVLPEAAAACGERSRTRKNFHPPLRLEGLVTSKTLSFFS